MKICQISPIIRKMQVQTIVRYHRIFSQTDIIKKKTDKKVKYSYVCKGKGSLCSVSGNVNYHSHYAKQCEYKIDAPYDSKIIFLTIYRYMVN